MCEDLSRSGFLIPLWLLNEYIKHPVTFFLKYNAVIGIMLRILETPIPLPMTANLLWMAPQVEFSRKLILILNFVHTQFIGECVLLPHVWAGSGRGSSWSSKGREWVQARGRQPWESLALLEGKSKIPLGQQLHFQRWGMRVSNPKGVLGSPLQMGSGQDYHSPWSPIREPSQACEFVELVCLQASHSLHILLWPSHFTHGKPVTG